MGPSSAPIPQSTWAGFYAGRRRSDALMSVLGSTSCGSIATASKLSARFLELICPLQRCRTGRLFGQRLLSGQPRSRRYSGFVQQRPGHPRGERVQFVAYVLAEAAVLFLGVPF